jgi:hypothetical protein
MKGRPGMVVGVCNPSTEETKTGVSRIWDQCGLHIETLSQKFFKTIKKKRKAGHSCMHAGEAETGRLLEHRSFRSAWVT